MTRTVLTLFFLLVWHCTWDACLLAQSSNDLPPTGRSLFDLILNGLPGAPEEHLRDFPSLVKEIEKATNNDIVYTLIPIGRSLQRLDAYPNFFEKPRIVLSFVADSGVPSAHWLALNNRLFLAYADSTKQMEIISYNDRASRFEFQIVKHVGESNQKPQIFYAKRSLCLACHKNGTPIFPEFPWSETPNNKFIQKALFTRHPAGNFLGFSVEDGMDGSDAAHLDLIIRNADSVRMLNYVWSDVCEKFSPIANVLQCRAMVLRLSLAGVEPGDHSLLESQASAMFSESQFAAMRFTFSPSLPNRDPFSNLTPVITRITADISSPGSEKDVDILWRNARTLPPEVNPVTEYPSQSMSPSDPFFAMTLRGKGRGAPGIPSNF